MTTILALVAINTMLFLGLSVSKMAPWPEPLHPSTLRAVASQEGDHTDDESRAVERLSVRQGLLLSLVVTLHRLGRRGP